MEKFLSSNKLLLHKLLGLSKRESSKEAVHVILGNPSCDLDSCVSALALAWQKNYTKPENVNCLYIPMMNIERCQFKIRTEIVYLLKELSIHQDHILFRDDVDLKYFCQFGKEKFKITLVDHHILARSDQSLEPFVNEIFDHRIKGKEISAEIRTNISLVGSCCTLVAKEILHTIGRSEIPVEIETMLLAGILVDTNNLSENAGKVTPQDVEMVKELQNVRSKVTLAELYNNLMKAKFSTEGLTTLDVILKDPKSIENSHMMIMFSTLHQPMEEFFQRSDAQNVLTTHCANNNLQAWVALAPMVDSYKPIAVLSTDKDLREKIVSELTASVELKIELSNEALWENLQFLRMYNTRKTRKQVLPVVNELLQKLDKRS